MNPAARLGLSCPRLPFEPDTGVRPPNPSETPTLSQFADLYPRPWIDTNPFQFDAPAEYIIYR